MFYVMKQRTLKANNHPDANVYDCIDEFKTYADALSFLKRIKPEVNVFVVEVKAVANYESIFDYVGGSIYEYEKEE